MKKFRRMILTLAAFTLCSFVVRFWFNSLEDTLYVTGFLGAILSVLVIIYCFQMEAAEKLNKEEDELSAKEKIHLQHSRDKILQIAILVLFAVVMIGIALRYFLG